MNNVKAEISNMKNDISRLDDSVQGINLHLENITDKNDQLLVKNCVPEAERYEVVSAQIDMLQMLEDARKGY